MLKYFRNIPSPNCIFSQIKRSSHIKIPDRVKKSSTDILYALGGTVGRDTTAAYYKYHDDPYLMPISNASKKIYAMANESGRKAAKWIKEEHSNLFAHQDAEPIIPIFSPKNWCDKEVDENLLKHLIKNADVRNAISVYNKLKENQVDLKPELHQSLLELICFYNHDEPVLNEWIEERWFKQNNEARERQGKTWKEGDLAETLFCEISPKTRESYSSMIRGFAKYRQTERAYSLFEEAIDKHVVLDVGTCNAVIRIINLLKETADQRWELAQNILKQIYIWRLKPNLDTVNSLLECVSTFGNYKFARKCSLQILAEAKILNIEPSLGTFYYILIIFCRDRGPISHVLVDILHKIAGSTFNVQHPKDTFFFATAMDVCRNHLNDKNLAKKVNTLLHTGNNYDLIGDSYKESIYYRHFLALLCQTESIDAFMEVYNSIVPNIYTPEPGIMEEILKAIEVNCAYELMPRIWSDMVIFDHINRQSLLQRSLNILVNMKDTKDESSSGNLCNDFATIAFDIFNTIAHDEYRSKTLSFNGQMIGYILTLLVRGAEFEKASEVFQYIVNNHHLISGSAPESSLTTYVEACVRNKNLNEALQCVEYASENQIDTQRLVEYISNGFILNDHQKQRLQSKYKTF